MEQSRCKVNMFAPGDGKFGQEASNLLTKKKPIHLEIQVSHWLCCVFGSKCNACQISTFFNFIGQAGHLKFSKVVIRTLRRDVFLAFVFFSFCLLAVPPYFCLRVNHCFQIGVMR